MPIITRGMSANLGKLSHDGKILLQHLQAELAKFGKDISEIKELVNAKNREIETLKETIVLLRNDRDDLKGQIYSLEGEFKKIHRKLDDEDQYQRRDSIVLSGSAVGTMTDTENINLHVKKLLKDHLNIDIESSDISVTHRLGPNRRGVEERRNIYVKFVRRDTKKFVIQSSKTQDRGATLFANESLTPLRRKMFHALRTIKKNVEAVKGCTTFEGNLYAFTKPLPNQTRDQRHHIPDMEALRGFCSEYVTQPLNTFLENTN